jgi:hypothetical protein
MYSIIETRKICIRHSSQSGSKDFDFSIKRFGGCIRGRITKKVEYFVRMLTCLKSNKIKMSKNDYYLNVKFINNLVA